MKTYKEYYKEEEGILGLVMTLILVVGIAAYFYWRSDSLLTGLVIGIIGVAGFLFAGYLKYRWGVRKHRLILNKKCFSVLIDHGFELDIRSEYHGLTGTYRGYILDVYYMWKTRIQQDVTGMHFQCYFKSPKNKDGKIDDAKMFRMAKKHSIAYFKFKYYDFYWQDEALIAKLFLGFTPPTSKKIMRNIDRAIDILEKEKLEPITQEELNQSREKNPFDSVPQIELYFENFIEQ